MHLKPFQIRPDAEYPFSSPLLEIITEFQRLQQSFSSAKARAEDISRVLCYDRTLLLSSWLGQYSGNWNNGFNNQGSNGYYWSSTQNNATNAYILNFNASNVNPGTTNNNKNNGFAVRCVAV